MHTEADWQRHVYGHMRYIRLTTTPTIMRTDMAGIPPPPLGSRRRIPGPCRTGSRPHTAPGGPGLPQPVPHPQDGPQSVIGSAGNDDLWLDLAGSEMDPGICGVGEHEYR